MNGIKQFPLSSLICLSLDFTDVEAKNENKFPFNSIKLQQFLESMSKLKQFHLYAKLNRDESNPESILGTFNDQFWSDRNWSFEMHDQYFYTLPFHFDQLHLNRSFDNVKSNNPEILKTNPRLWYHVKIISLHFQSKYDVNFMKELKMKMPKLTTIQFRDYSPRYSGEIHGLIEKAKIQLDSVTTVHFEFCMIERVRDWLIYALPNVKYLAIRSAPLPLLESKLIPILNRQIEQLYIDTTPEHFEELTETNHIYCSNVQHIHFSGRVK